jgi:hypothetical protein
MAPKFITMNCLFFVYMEAMRNVSNLTCSKARVPPCLLLVYLGWGSAKLHDETYC